MKKMLLTGIALGLGLAFSGAANAQIKLGVGGPFTGANAAALLTWPDDPSLVDRTTLLDLPGDPERPAAVAVLAPDVRVSEHDGARVLSR